ncbi:hypothetical protein [Thomasclavelia sp.]|uniref:hypothetical protein n=1 Tax=Thomasclavelia sp. TaxID=3025757 RepID=UPI0025DFFA90|nr:hypothetical protein [Thomasclavelia sp.]
MKLKRILFVLVCMMLFSTKVYAKEGSTEISTTVPEKHTVTLDIDEYGYVLIDGKRYDSKDKYIEVARLSKCKYTIVVEEGYVIESVYYGDELVELIDNSFIAPEINEEIKLKVNFAKKSISDSEIGKDETENKETVSNEKIDSVNTGDESKIMMTLMLLIVSGLMIRRCYKK